MRSSGEDDAGTHSGVYIPIRHTASWLPVAVGGRLFPGVHKHARFTASEQTDHITVALSAPGTSVEAEIQVTDEWQSALFGSLDEASSFFQSGAVGWSPTRDGGTLEGLELQTTAWKVDAGAAISMRSSFFDALPPGSAELDCVLVMRSVPITWSIPRVAAPGEFARA